MRAFSVLFFLMGLLLATSAVPISIDSTDIQPGFVEEILNKKFPENSEDFNILFRALGCTKLSCVVNAIREDQESLAHEAHNSVEDYVHGCGPRDENSYEANETFYKDDISKRSAETDSQTDEKSEVEVPNDENDFDADEEVSDDGKMGERERRETKQSDESNSPESDESKEKKSVAAVGVVETAATVLEVEIAQEAKESPAAVAE